MDYLVKLFALCLIIGTIGCSDDETPPNNIDPNDPSLVIWEGPSISFRKENGSDPSLEENQDRISDNVWLTRSNEGGQIFNIVLESSANKSNSPLGTEWALGRTSDLTSLSFSPFRQAVGEPKEVVGKDLVLHLIDEDVYLDIRFTSWGQNKSGGFAYERSTP